jgi:Zn-dependent protease
MGGIRIARMAGIDILVHPSWFLVLALITWSLSEGLFREEHPDWEPAAAWVAGIITSLLLFTSLLMHEFSHCIVARWRGLEVKSITLFIFGGVSALKGEPREPADELRIAVIGPATSFALAALFAIAGLGLWGTGADTAAFYLAVINAILGVFNLLPGFPLDGGRVLRAALWARSGSLFQATRTAAQIGGGIAFVLMGGGVLIALTGAFLSGVWLIVIGWFLRSQADASYSQLVAQNILEKTPITAVMESDYTPVHPQTTLLSLLQDYVLQHNARYYPVSVDGDLRGLMSVSDLGRLPRDQWGERTVGEAMTPASRLHTLTPNDNLSRAADLIASTNVNQLPVLEDGHLVGFVTRAGVIRAMQIRQEIGLETSRAMAPGSGSDS